jgi:hypothetical protein
MVVDKAASRARVRAIRDILNEHWDPIGVFPEALEDAPDEYQSYAGKLSAMIREGATDETLLTYLKWAEAEHMGFGRFDEPRALRVIAAVRALGTAP